MFSHKRVITLLYLFYFTLSAYGQSEIAQNGADQEIKRIVKELNQLPESREMVDKCFDLAKYYIDMPGEVKKDIQTAQEYCSRGLAFSRQHNLTQEIARGNVLQAQIFREKGEQSSAAIFADKALSMVDKVSDPATLADIYFEKANYFTLDSDSEMASKTRYYRLGVLYLKQASPNTIKLADALKYLGDLYGLQIGSNGASMPLLFESLAIYKANKYEKLQAIYDLIGYGLARMERRREGLKYSLLAVRTGERFKDSTMTMSAIYNRLSYAYNNLGENEKSAESMMKAIMYARHNHEDATAHILTSNLVVAYINLKAYSKALQLTRQTLKIVAKDQVRIRILLLTDLLRIYSSMGKYELAKPIDVQLQQLSKGTEQPAIIWDLMYSAEINLFIKIGDFKRVDSLIAAYRRVNKISQNLMVAVKAEEFSYKSDSAQHRYAAAFFHHQAFKKLNDSVMSRDHDKETAQLQLQFETEKKDQDIASKSRDIRLLTRQTKLQKASLLNEALIRNLSLLAVCMLVVLSGVIYNRYQLKRRANNELKEQKEEINTQNDALKELITEREWLIKEVHHRVKNNLQIVISLLNSQSAYIDDISARDVIRESKNRINSISMIHQKLYQTDDLAGVDMYQYIHELVDYIASTFGTGPNVQFVLTIDRLSLDVAQAVPLGLIINEGLTNAVKYALSPGGNAIICVKLQQHENAVTLHITDNGKGLPADFDVLKLKSLGMVLMRGLSRQLGGDLLFRNNNGLELSMSFRMTRLLGEPLSKAARLKMELLT
jgi:two-component sensor histidine kinase